MMTTTAAEIVHLFSQRRLRFGTKDFEPRSMVSLERSGADITRFYLLALTRRLSLALTRRSHGEHGEHPEQSSGCKRDTLRKWPWTRSGEMEVVVCEWIDLAY